MLWRKEVAKAAGLPPLLLMEGFWASSEEDPFSPFALLKYAKTNLRDSIQRNVLDCLPIKWECLKPSPLYILLNHSDCGGIIESEDCFSIACALEDILPNIPDVCPEVGYWKGATEKFIKGLRMLPLVRGINESYSITC